MSLPRDARSEFLIARCQILFGPAGPERRPFLYLDSIPDDPIRFDQQPRHVPAIVEHLIDIAIVMPNSDADLDVIRAAATKAFNRQTGLAADVGA